ncbi:MAG: methyltransferase domain-containing protein [Woeseia sp.]|nr:methyltransferase domain-containing protein [Gammaproteobacteria bacterium]NNE61918.1 methyltransferase domain-containing protein [Woeseia sp.]
MQGSPDAGSGLVRKLAARLRKTPFHPQWFAFFREDRGLRETCESLSGTVLDVGCADGKPRRFLDRAVDYVGIDYYSTATGWYGTKPDVFADAQALPLGDECADHSLLLDVLEHIPDPDRCLAEIGRVLKPGGSLTIQVPFLYPVHDAPLDFHRWTRFGLQEAANRHGFRVAELRAIGHPLETAALNANIAVSQTVINWIRQKNPLALLGLLLPILVPLNNVLAWIFASLGRDDELMPYSFKMVWIKN